MKLRNSLFIFSALIIYGSFGSVNAQLTRVEYNRLLRIPMQYTALKTSDKIVIDGKDDDEDWNKAPWTPGFTDIASGEEGNPQRKVRCKILWDDSSMYVFARLQETDLWASITRHDDRVFQDNAFEIFISPGGSANSYFEFEINAYATVWDLFLSKPFRNGGQNLSSWDIIGLKKAVQLDGTLNDPSDSDNGWSVELAIPFQALKMSGNNPPADGTIWRMNFSRVQWDLDTLDGKYFRKKDATTGSLLPAHYLVWSPQGIVNLHYPERWGYVRFSDQLSTESFLSSEKENLKLVLWKYYYLQQEYKRQHGKYADRLKQLKKLYEGPPFFNESHFKIKMYSDKYQFLIRGYAESSQEYFSVNDHGELHISKLPE